MAISTIFHHFFARLPETPANLTGRVFIVTGSNTGIGFALAVHLARRNPARLILAVRDVTKGETAKKEIIAQTGFTGSVEVWELDMARFESVKQFAERANQSLERLDGAVLNAGISLWKWTMTAEGWESMLQINALSTGLLGVLLLPLLQRTSNLAAPDAFAMAPHLTLTGSAGMFLAKFTDRSKPKILEAMNVEGGSDVMDRYITSKLFDLFIARKIAALNQAKGVVVNVVDPGLCASDLARDLGLSAFIIAILRAIAWTCSKGALNLLYGVLNGTPPGAYIMFGKLCQPPDWTLTDTGLRVEEQIWNEMMDVWREISPEVVDIVAA
ncbi:hypothetical protein FB45DRAFT_921667 [Roridomyces roridus]|uniref:NAD(P)-binding protein n=1 Tax=Roridomyces roridus TaxID=1738132 RepID=A0AAD7FI79_9AGAR|nr:hypothetical protein FB45DRAFT_921667 [Roridomyces roridus]